MQLTSKKRKSHRLENSSLFPTPFVVKFLREFLASLDPDYLRRWVGWLELGTFTIRLTTGHLRRKAHYAIDAVQKPLYCASFPWNRHRFLRGLSGIAVEFSCHLRWTSRHPLHLSNIRSIFTCTVEDALLSTRSCVQNQCVCSDVQIASLWI